MKRKLFNLWVLVAAAALVFATSCESDELDYVKEKPGTGDTETPIDPPTISFNGSIAIDESGEWPVASVEVNVSEDADYWYWMFEETRAYAEWTQKSPAKTKIEFPVLRTGDYTLSIKAENKGGESKIATDTFSAAIPEKYGDVFAAIDWELNEERTAVTFNIQTTDATENWYWEFAKEEDATTFDGEITEIPASFTKGEKNEFTIDEFEQDTKYKMTVISENAGGRKATSAKVSYFADSNSGNYEGPTHPAYIKLDVKPLSITRTEFDGEGIIWKDGDKFGILTATAAGEVLQNIGAYKSDEPYLMELADDAAFIYGYYPYDADLDAEDINLSSFIVFYKDEYTYASDDDKSSISGAYPMIAPKVSIPEDYKENDEVKTFDMTFESMNATLVIVNIYGATEEENIDNFWFITDEGHGTAKIDLTGDEPAYTAGFGSGETFGKYTATAPINGDEANGVKAYFIVAKGTYAQNNDENYPAPSIEINTKNGSKYTYLFDGEDLVLDKDFQEFSINIADLEEEKEPDALLAFEAFDGAEQFVQAPNTFSATIKLNIPNPIAIEWMAVAALPTGSESADASFMTPETVDGVEKVEHGYFINQAKRSYDAYDNELIMPYVVFTGMNLYDSPYFDNDTNTLVLDESLLLFGGEFDGSYDQSKGVLFEPGEKYTIAVYIQPSAYANGYTEPIIVSVPYEPAEVEYSDTTSGKVELTEPVISGTNVTATASGTGIEKIAAFGVLADSDTSDDYWTKPENLAGLLKDNDARFEPYEDDIELSGTLFAGYKYVFIAVGMDANGELTQAVAKIAEPKGVQYTSNSEITKITPTQQTSTQYISVTVEATKAEKIRVLQLSKSQVDDSSSSDDTQSKVTYDNLAELFKVKSGIYETAEVKDGKAVFTDIYIPSSTRPASDGSSNQYWDTSKSPFEYLGGEEFVLVFCPVTEGSDGDDLGHIQQLTGNFAAQTLYDVTENEGYSSTYYIGATTSELAEDGPGQGGSGETVDLWTSYVVPFFNYDKYGSSIFAYDDNGATKLWLIELAQNIPEEDHTYPFPADAKMKYRNMLAQLFKNYATEKKPSADANILVSFEGSSVPKNSTTGEFPWSDYTWAQDWKTDSVYALVAEYEENVFGAAVYTFDNYGDWESMGSVNANNKPSIE